MNKARTCVPIRESSAEELDQKIRGFLQQADSVEVWLECIEAVPVEKVRRLAETFGDQLLFLFRQGEKNTRHYSLHDRIRCYEQLSGTRAWIDCDLEEFPEDLEKLAHFSERPDLICSYHNFEETPDEAALQAVVERMEVYRPTVYKLACACHCSEDAYRLLGLLLRLQSDGKRAIVLGMGKAGMITRLAGSIWGNELIFTPTPDSSVTAPGQISLEDMKRFYQLMED